MTRRWSQLNTWISERRVKIKDAAINVRRAFALVWQAHPPSALAMLGCTLVGAFLPVGQAWVGKLIVDGVVNAINARTGAEAGLRAVLPYLVVEFVLFVAQAANGQARTLAEHILHSQIISVINARIIRKALELDLSHFDKRERQSSTLGREHESRYLLPSLDRRTKRDGLLLAHSA
jgi:ATP-binding cassette subfamily B protein